MINNKALLNKVDINSKDKKVQDIEISIDNKSKILEASIDIYVNKFRFITELVSNAYDATIERAIQLGIDKQEYIINNPVVVSFNKNENGQGYILTIKESSGVGISQERMNEVFLFLNKSTKENSEDFIGQKGKGRLSTLTYTEAVVYNTYFEGTLTNYTLSRYKEESRFGQLVMITSPQLVTNFTTNLDRSTVVDSYRNETNYTEVIIPIKEEDHKRALFEIFKQLQFFTNIAYSIPDFYKIEKFLNENILYQFNNFIISSIDSKLSTYTKRNELFRSFGMNEWDSYVSEGNNRGVTVLLDKVPYRVPVTIDSADPRNRYLNIYNYLSNGYSYYSHNYMCMAIKMGTSDLLPNESRESIILGDIYVYYKVDGNTEERCSVTEAIDLQTHTIKEGYIRKTINVVDLILDKIEESIKEFQEYLTLNHSSRTDNIFTYLYAPQMTTFNIGNGEMSTTFDLPRNSIYDELRIGTIPSDWQKYNDKLNLIKQEFNYPKEYRSENIDLCDKKNTIFIVGNKIDKAKNKYIESKKIDNLYQISSNKLSDIDSKQKLLVAEIEKDAREFGFIMYSDISDNDLKGITTVTTDEVIPVYNADNYYHKIKIGELLDEKFMNSDKKILYIDYNSDSKPRNKDRFPTELRCYRQVYRHQFDTNYKYISTSGISIDKLLMKAESLGVKDRVIRIESDDYFSILKSDTLFTTLPVILYITIAIYETQDYIVEESKSESSLIPSYSRYNLLNQLIGIINNDIINIVSLSIFDINNKALGNKSQCIDNKKVIEDITQLDYKEQFNKVDLLFNKLKACISNMNIEFIYKMTE